MKRARKPKSTKAQEFETIETITGRGATTSAFSFAHDPCKPLKARCPFVARVARIWVHLEGVLAKVHDSENSGGSPETLILKGDQGESPQGFERWI